MMIKLKAMENIKKSIDSLIRKLRQVIIRIYNKKIT
jgi:hypothetical protein